MAPTVQICPNERKAAVPLHNLEQRRAAQGYSPHLRCVAISSSAWRRSSRIFSTCPDIFSGETGNLLSRCRGKGGRPARGAATLRRSWWPRRLRRCDAATLPANPRRCDASDAATLRRSRRTPDAATPPTLRRCDAPGSLRRYDASGAATLRRSRRTPDAATPPTLRRSRLPPTLRRLRRCDAATLPAPSDAATPPALRRCDAPRRCDAFDAATIL